MAVLPDAGYECNMRMTSERKRQQERRSLVRTPRNYRALPYEPPKRMNNFQINQMGCMKFLATIGDSPFDAMSVGGLQQPLDCGRRVENNQRSSRPSRIMRAESIGTVTGSSL